MKNKFKTVSLDVMIDKHIGKLGTKKREEFERELIKGEESGFKTNFNREAFLENINDKYNSQM